jgi:hypothetical protein
LYFGTSFTSTKVQILTLRGTDLHLQNWTGGGGHAGDRGVGEGNALGGKGGGGHATGGGGESRKAEGEYAYGEGREGLQGGLFPPIVRRRT